MSICRSLILVSLWCACSPQLSLAGADLGQRALVRRDAYGVPHILAEDEGAAAFALGYVAGEDYLPVLARLFLRARGEEASVFGEGAAERDFRIHALGIHRVARERFPS